MSPIISFWKRGAEKNFAAVAFCANAGFWGLGLKLFRKGRREGASGVLVRLVSLWWEFPPRLDSNNNILVRQKQQFFVFQNELNWAGFIELSYDPDITSFNHPTPLAKRGRR